VHQLASNLGNDRQVALSIARDLLDRSPENSTALVQLFCREQRAVELRLSNRTQWPGDIVDRADSYRDLL